ncbi:MAG TPA: SDR family oxidoreductase [Dehalococcoidia bacterium]|nr:SDR family oxidoreductase [Dehalococcoidia bacterium]
MPCGSKPVNAGQRHSPTPKNSQQEHQQELRCEITRLANKVAIVTGAGTRSQNVSGVGVATAKAFADQGAKILIVDMDETAAQITESAITEAGGEASIYVADVAHESGCRELVEAAVESYGKLDILMNSVGILGRGSVMEIEEDSWQRVFDVNLKGMAFISKFAVPAMIDSGGGSIINISSVDGIRAGMSHSITYAASKGGVIAMTRAMAVHHGRDNIRVNCIAPGMIYTSMVEAVNEKRRELRRQIAPLGTEGTAEDVALAAVFLASDESRWITGVLLPVDAGLMAAGPQSILSNIIGDDGTLLE